MKDTVNNTVKHWWIPLTSGILLIGLGFLVFNTPMESYLTLAVLFQASFFITGIMQMVYAISNRKVLSSWGWTLTSGIIDLLFAILLVSNPGITISILPIYVGFILLFKSTIGIGWAVNLQQMKAKQWRWALLGSILGLVLSFLMILNPVFGGLSIVFYTGFIILMIGIVQISIAFSLKKIKKEIKESEAITV